MATIGAEELSAEFGGPLGVAEAVLEGRVNSFQQRFVWEVVPKSSPMWEAARIRFEAKQISRRAKLAEKVVLALAMECETIKGKRVYLVTDEIQKDIEAYMKTVPV